MALIIRIGNQRYNLFTMTPQELDELEPDTINKVVGDILNHASDEQVLRVCKHLAEISITLRNRNKTTLLGHLVKSYLDKNEGARFIQACAEEKSTDILHRSLRHFQFSRGTTAVLLMLKDMAANKPLLSDYLLKMQLCHAAWLPMIKERATEHHARQFTTHSVKIKKTMCDYDLQNDILERNLGLESPGYSAYLDALFMLKHVLDKLKTQLQKDSAILIHIVEQAHNILRKVRQAITDEEPIGLLTRVIEDTTKLLTNKMTPEAYRAKAQQLPILNYSALKPISLSMMGLGIAAVIAGVVSLIVLGPAWLPIAAILLGALVTGVTTAGYSLIHRKELAPSMFALGDTVAKQESVMPSFA